MPTGRRGGGVGVGVRGHRVQHEEVAARAVGAGHQQVADGEERGARHLPGEDDDFVQALGLYDLRVVEH